jgi:hypothetical protein
MCRSSYEFSRSLMQYIAVLPMMHSHISHKMSIVARLNSEVAQRKGAGLITRRSQDRNLFSLIF